MLKTDRAIIVEGKYDKINLSGIVDALIIETDGFRVFKDKDLQKLIKRLAYEKGIIIFTDSDAAGFKIRAFVAKIVPKGTFLHAYIPDVIGKEKRKTSPSAEGKLGLEGIDNDVIIDALIRAGINESEGKQKEPQREITAFDLMSDGLCGTNNSKVKREEFLEFLSLPVHLSTSSLLKLLNSVYGYDFYKRLISDFYYSEKNSQ